ALGNALMTDSRAVSQSISTRPTVCGRRQPLALLRCVGLILFNDLFNAALARSRQNASARVLRNGVRSPTNSCQRWPQSPKQRADVALVEGAGGRARPALDLAQTRASHTELATTYAFSGWPPVTMRRFQTPVQNGQPHQFWDTFRGLVLAERCVHPCASCLGRVSRG